MMIRTTTVLFFFILIGTKTYSEDNRPSPIRCSYQDERNNKLISDAGFRRNFFKSENASGGEQLAAQRSSTGYIPVIVHVLYHTPNDIVPDSQIVKMIDLLNDDFTRNNVDAGNTPADFLPYAGAANFRFCFASQDPLGNPSNGIEHVYTDSTIFSNPYYMRRAAMGGIDSWNVNHYFNIWVGHSNSSMEPVLSLSVYNLPSSGCGVSIETDYLFHLERGDASPLYSGRQITHGVGHCFSLAHIFDATTCIDDDSISDTPIQSGPNYGCPSFPLYGCVQTYPGQMFMNYMDFTDENCRNMFTIEQITKMENAITSVFPNLITNNVSCFFSGEEEIQKSGFDLFPNPVMNSLSVQFKSTLPRRIVIRDMTGRVAIAQNVLDARTGIDVSGLASGVYVVETSEGGMRVFVKAE